MEVAFAQYAVEAIMPSRMFVSRLLHEDGGQRNLQESVVVFEKQFTNWFFQVEIVAHTQMFALRKLLNHYSKKKR